MAAVFGPREPRHRGREEFDRATLEVVVRPSVGIHGAAERELEGHLLRQLGNIVVLEEYPRTQITVVLQISAADGSVGAVAGNAAFLALLDAGVAMRATCMSVSVGVQFTEEDADAMIEGPPVLLLDPTAQEEEDCDAVVTVSVDGSRGQLAASMSSGAALDAVAWSSCMAAGTKACKVLESFLRMSLQKRLETFLKPAAAASQP